MSTVVLMYPALVGYILRDSNYVFIMLTIVTFCFLCFLICTLFTTIYAYLVTSSVPTDPLVIK